VAVSGGQPATARWEALGTTALVRVGDPAALQRARELLAAELERIDRAASRFRPDSELERVNACAGRFVAIGPLLHEALAVALAAAKRTQGAVDPTLGAAIRLAGYTRDYAELQRVSGGEGPIAEQAPPSDTTEAGEAESTPGPHLVRVSRTPGWEAVRLSDDPRGVLVPPGVALDLGATAKALAADRAARAIADATGAGTLVSLGGDIAVAGPPPPGGWLVHVTDDHRSGPDAPGQTVSIQQGALATSSTTTRRWRHRGQTMHHILDPSTGEPARGPWRTVSVAAPSCVEANTASTAAIVLGERALAWLAEQRLPARLVARDGEVKRLGGWPAPQRSREPGQP
jgi:thiamine biosynthesis lipoprotein